MGKRCASGAAADHDDVVTIHGFLMSFVVSEQ